MFPYIGGKCFHVKHLNPILPTHALTYVDVFGGAGWMSTKSTIMAPTCVYNDYNPHLSNVFKQLTTNQQQILAELQKHPERCPHKFNQFLANHFNNPQFTTPAAAEFLYILSHQFSGNTLKPTSKFYHTGKINKYLPIINKLQDKQWQRQLKRITNVENMDCIDVIKKYDSPDTVFYCDPPYYKLEHYYIHDFPRHKHLELADTLKSIRGRFAISYYDFPELHNWFPHSHYRWHRYNIKKPSSRNCGTHRIGTEVVITNY